MNSRVQRGRRGRQVSSERSKGYKLAAKYRLLYVNGVVHVLTKRGRGEGGPVALGGVEGEETSDAGDVRRLVPECDLFDVLWDTSHHIPSQLSPS